ncbi:MAG TPA: hypothetical protein VMT24_11285, partial [Aggregatilineaceae bacterium]|nr:hypothetical protein [Aggregatilineaceae bacterium]
MDTAHVESADGGWNWLYKVGGIAALIIAVCIPIQIIVYMAWPPPTTVMGYFTLFQNNKLLGLLDLDLLIVTDTTLGIPVLLGLYVALKRANPSFMAIALALGLVATVSYFASNTSFNMLALSDQYAAATTEAQRSTALAAGQAMLAIYNGTAFHMNYILGAISL